MKTLIAYISVCMSLLVLLSGVTHAEEKISQSLPTLSIGVNAEKNKVENHKIDDAENIKTVVSKDTLYQSGNPASLVEVNTPKAEIGKHVNEEIDLLSMIASLSVVLALIGVSAFLLKRMQGGKGTLNGLKLVSSLHIGTKEKIVVVQAGDKQWILGVTPHQINLLSELTEPLTLSHETKSELNLPSAIAAMLKKTPKK